VVILHCRGPSRCFRRLLSRLKNVGSLIDLAAGPLTHHTPHCKPDPLQHF
jgi:hypothetical protein